MGGRTEGAISVPADLTHDQFETNGISMHVAQQGDGPAVILVHGFPELWFSWRHQLPALAGAGLRAIAPDMRGFGETTISPDIEDYTQENICADLVALLDCLKLKDAVFVGHDWGGAVVWNMALHHPTRVRAVAGVNTPFIPHLPMNPLEMMTANPGRFDYQLYFQEPGVAEAELEADIRRTFTLFFRSSRPEDRLGGKMSTAGVRERGGLLVGAPTEVSRSVMLSESELMTFVRTYEKTGFRGGLNWYRNHERNWEWSKQTAGQQVLQPALMITAGKDAILTPEMSKGMEKWVPNLTRGHIEECSHWTQQEAPDDLNRILIDWLHTLPNPS
jgi:soluble epoxide hydrolase/lipid-phosphate phosphatase